MFHKSMKEHFIYMSRDIDIFVGVSPDNKLTRKQSIDHKSTTSKIRMIIWEYQYIYKRRVDLPLSSMSSSIPA